MRHHLIVLKNVCVHNLKGVDLTLRSHELIVFTGVSGSGKSSMAFDTLFVEGQRRYVESLSTTTQRSLGGQMHKPAVDFVQGLSPTIAIEQKSVSKNPRSTVGTLTTIYDYLRLLFAKLGVPHCPRTGKPLTPQSPEQIFSALKKIPTERLIILLAPYARGKKGAFKEEAAQLLRKGWTKARVDGTWVSLDEMPTLDKNQTHDIDIVIDRLRLTSENEARLAQALHAALDLGEGLVRVVEGEEERLFSTMAYSSEIQCSYPPLDPADFSFNSPSGMCPSCHGLGVAPHGNLTILLERQKQRNTEMPSWRDPQELLSQEPCPACQGGRLKPYPAATKFFGYRLPELTQFSIQELATFFSTLTLTETEKKIGEEVMRAIQQHLSFLIEVGLEYLQLDRTAPTLSGGEAQRVRLASQIGSGLTGVTYVLDEPSIGLHPRDNYKLIASLKQLRDQGNTVIVVEHDEEMMRAADCIVDFGPGPGKLGGELLFNGSFAHLLSHPTSLTAQYLSGRKTLPLPTERRPWTHSLTLKGATHHNLKNCTVTIPLGVLTVVTGVSGSGKSSLICDTLEPALAYHFHGTEGPCGPYTSLEGIEQLDKIISVNQAPIGRTPRSNPATYIKLFDDIRDLFSSLPESRAKGYTKGRFSFNVAEGSCPTCRGMGMLRIDMDFLEDQWIPCTTCHNQRFDQETLAITYKGKNIHDVLAMTVNEALELFSAHPTIQRKLEWLNTVGLSYLTLGQSATTLSGGEAQRIKLAKELVRPATGKTLYILDEPTTGLHFHDVAALLKILYTLVERGNTVVVIEHHLDIIKAADWILELGPGAGAAGGAVIAEGTPETIAQKKTATAHILTSTEVTSISHPATPPNTIQIRGAAQNNLRHLSLSLPRGKITVCTGPSGSGKSSFAFDTVYAEGQRRYIESLAPYARQFVTQMPQPKVDLIEGLSPAIALEQKLSSGNPRSTVGTLTEIYDYLRLLFAKVGVPHSPETGLPLYNLTIDDVATLLLEERSGKLLTFLAPLKTRSLEALRKLGFLRIRLDGEIYEMDAPIPLAPKKKQNLELVVDRLRVEPNNRSRLVEALTQCVLHGEGQLRVLDGPETLSFSPYTSETASRFARITPHLFSFNHAEGMCLFCRGLGGFKDALCSHCKGARLNSHALHVLIEKQSIASLSALPLSALYAFLKDKNYPLLEEVLTHLHNRLHFLCDVGLGYLSLDRTAPTLSNGEAQRIRLAQQLGSQLTDVLYVLDEPTVGLHPHDNGKLNRALKQLNALGNTLLLVEHDPLTIACADHILEFGPGAGKEGGALVFEGDYEALCADSTSLTGAYLSGKKQIAPPAPRRIPKTFLPIVNASTHNLKNLNFNLPVGGILCVLSGVSGSGKSTLMHEVIAPLVTAQIKRRQDPFDTLRIIDQQPIGHTARSDVATYSEILTPLRYFYAQLASARTLGLDSPCFSPNHYKGMCRHCRGMGYTLIDRLFLPPVQITCEHCQGMRLNPISLSVTHEGLHLGNLLQLTVDQVAARFSLIPAITRSLKTLQDVGLGYLQLGQEVASLSGGEAQRLKLSRELSRRSTRNTLFLFDEPTTGLHPDDIRKLLLVLNKLIDKGNTCLLIEHNVDLIAAADYVIDMGPGAGAEGGHIVAQGTPEKIALSPSSLTAPFLKNHFISISIN